jgi:probable HAF family extracellular repeat protein
MQMATTFGFHIGHAQLGGNVGWVRAVAPLLFAAALLSACGGGGDSGLAGRESPAALDVAARVVAAPLYSVTDLGSGYGTDINNKGQVAGVTSHNGEPLTQAFLYSGDTMQDIGADGIVFSGAGFGINSKGQVTGWVRLESDLSYRRAFLYTSGTIQLIEHVASPGPGVYVYGSVGNGVNDRGQVAGTTYFYSSFTSRAFLYSDGITQDLGTLGGSGSSGYAINNKGQVTGSSTLIGNTETHAFLYSGDTMQDLGTLGGSNSYGNAINNKGQVTGESDLIGNTGRRHAFLYSDSKIQDLGTLGGDSAGNGINGNGQVVGMFYVADGTYEFRAFVYTDGIMRDLNGLLDNSGAGWVLWSAYAINDAGQITGLGYLNGQPRAFLLTPLKRGNGNH